MSDVIWHLPNGISWIFLDFLSKYLQYLVVSTTFSSPSAVFKSKGASKAGRYASGCERTYWIRNTRNFIFRPFFLEFTCIYRAHVRISEWFPLFEHLFFGVSLVNLLLIFVWNLCILNWNSWFEFPPICRSSFRTSVFINFFWNFQREIPEIQRKNVEVFLTTLRNSALALCLS